MRLLCLQIEEMVEVPVVLELASDLLDRRCPIFRCASWLHIHTTLHGPLSAVQMLVLILMCFWWILRSSNALRTGLTLTLGVLLAVCHSFAGMTPACS
jgi:hypothetical protein